MIWNLLRSEPGGEDSIVIKFDNLSHQVTTASRANARPGPAESVRTSLLEWGLTKTNYRSHKGWTTYWDPLSKPSYSYF